MFRPFFWSYILFFPLRHSQLEFDTNSSCFAFRCKTIAAVARRAGEPLVIEEIIVAPPRHREVRIRIICTSLCRSDATFWNMQVFFSQSFNYLLLLSFFFFFSSHTQYLFGTNSFIQTFSSCLIDF